MMERLTSIERVRAPQPAARGFEAGGERTAAAPEPSDRERMPHDLARLKRQLAGEKPRADRLRRVMARAGDRLTIVDLVQVDWIESADWFACLHVGAASHLVRRTLGGLEHQLDPARFFRLDRFAIVNLGHVVDVRPDGRGEPTAVLEDGTALRMTPGRLEALRRRVSTHGPA